MDQLATGLRRLPARPAGPAQRALPGHGTGRGAVLAVLTAVAVAAATGLAVPAHAAPVDPEATDVVVATDVVPAEAGQELPDVVPEETEQPDQLPDGEPQTVSAIVTDGADARVITRDAEAHEVAQVTEELSAQPGVLDVAVDTPVAITGSPDAYRTLQWSLDDLGYGRLPAGTPDGSGQLVAVLDTGIWAAHEDLAGRVRCDLGADFATDASTVDPAGRGCVDPQGHGTHVAGEISAVSDNSVGIAGASNAQLMPVRVLDATGSGTSATVSAGITWAVDHGADVISMSLGGGYNSMYDTAVRYATDRGVVVVAAAGNNRQTGNVVNYPAASPGAIAVAATDDTRTSASFSYAGPTNLIAAPGYSVLSTDSSYGYVYRSGTSMAAPLVSAVLARYLDAHPGATVAGVRTAVVGTAIDLETAGFDDNTGYGLIGAYQLITGQPLPVAAGPTAPTEPTIQSVSPGNATALVRWAAPADDGGSPITGYTVRAYAGSTVIKPVTTGAGATSTTVTGLTNGTAYRFSVTATNAVGDGPGRTTSAAYTPRTVPSAPTAPTVSAGAGKVTVRWAAPASGGSAITGYTVRTWRGSTQVASSTLPATARSLAVPGLANGTSYRVTVTATNAAGAGKASAYSATVIPRTTPSAPRVSAAAGTRAATVSWVAPANGGSAITSYTVRTWRGSTLVKTATVSAGARRLVVTGLSPASTYRFTVTATNGAGAGKASAYTSTVRPRA